MNAPRPARERTRWETMKFAARLKPVARSCHGSSIIVTLTGHGHSIAGQLGACACSMPCSPHLQWLYTFSLIWQKHVILKVVEYAADHGQSECDECCTFIVASLCNTEHACSIRARSRPQYFGLSSPPHPVSSSSDYLSEIAWMKGLRLTGQLQPSRSQCSA